MHKTVEKNKYGRNDLFELVWNFPVNKHFSVGGEHIYGINSKKIYRHEHSCNKNTQELVSEAYQFRSVLVHNNGLIAVKTDKDVVKITHDNLSPLGTKCGRAARAWNKNGGPRFVCTDFRTLRSNSIDGGDEIEHIGSGLRMEKLEVVGAWAVGLVEVDEGDDNRKKIFEACFGMRAYCQEWQLMYVGQQMIVDITHAGGQILGLVEKNGAGNELEIKVLERTHSERKRKKREEF